MLCSTEHIFRQRDLSNDPKLNKNVLFLFSVLFDLFFILTLFLYLKFFKVVFDLGLQQQQKLNTK